MKYVIHVYHWNVVCYQILVLVPLHHPTSTIITLNWKQFCSCGRLITLLCANWIIKQIILRAYADGCWRIDLIITGALHTFIVYFCSKWQIDCPSVLIYNKRYINNSHLYSAINLLAMHSRDPTPLFVCVHARCLIVSLKDHDRQHGDSCCSAPPSVWRAAEIGGKPHLPATSASTHAYLSYYSQPHGRARAHTHAHARVLMTSILCVRMRVISAVMLTICWRFVEMQAKCTA